MLFKTVLISAKKKSKYIVDEIMHKFDTKETSYFSFGSITGEIDKNGKEFGRIVGEIDFIDKNFIKLLKKYI